MFNVMSHSSTIEINTLAYLSSIYKNSLASFFRVRKDIWATMLLHPSLTIFILTVYTNYELN